MVDKRTLEKYEKEAKEINRETWYLSWCMDTNAEERNKGKTVEVGLRYSAENKFIISMFLGWPSILRDGEKAFHHPGCSWPQVLCS